MVRFLTSLLLLMGLAGGIVSESFGIDQLSYAQDEISLSAACNQSLPSHGPSSIPHPGHCSIDCHLTHCAAPIPNTNISLKIPPSITIQFPEYRSAPAVGIVGSLFKPPRA